MRMFRHVLALLQKIVGGGAGMAHAKNENLSAAQRHRLFVRMVFGPLEARQPLLVPLVQGVSKPVERRGHHKGQGHRERQQHQPVAGQLAVFHHELRHDQSEFAVTGQRQRG